MEYTDLERRLSSAMSVRLLRSDAAALVISFLYQHYKGKPVISIAYSELLEKLEYYLEALRETGTPFPRQAKDYLKEWADERGMIRILRRGSNEEQIVELTPDAERVIGWVETLERRDFIGTESRFQDILTMLDDLVSRSTEDVDVRLTQLETQKRQLQDEIDRIRATGQVQTYSSTQIRERFQRITDTSRQLLNDFRAVEENFRTIARQVQEAQLQPNARKGTVVAAVISGEERLKESDEGRSFYAFWDFLTSPESRERLQTLLDQVYSMDELAEVTARESWLRRMVSKLLAEGELIVQSNRRLAEQLRRMLDEQNLQETRRVRELIAEIKYLASQVIEQPPGNTFVVEVDVPADVQPIMARPLWQPHENIVFQSAPDLNSADALDDALFLPLLHQFFVSETELRRQVEHLLESRDQVSLGDVVAHFPPRKGVAEIVSYLALAAKETRHQIAYDVRVPISVPLYQAENTWITLRVPQVLFRRLGEA